MTFDDIRKLALAMARGRGRYVLRHGGAKSAQKLLARLKEDGDSLVVLGVPLDERDMSGGEPAEAVLLHRPLQGLSDRAGPAVEGQTRQRRTAAAPALAGAGLEGSGARLRCRPGAITPWRRRECAMNENQFLDAALQNPVNPRLADELFRLALPDAWIVSGCLVQTVWNRTDRPRGRLRHRRLRRVLFRSRPLMAGRGCGDPASCRKRSPHPA